MSFQNILDHIEEEKKKTLREIKKQLKEEMDKLDKKYNEKRKRSKEFITEKAAALKKKMEDKTGSAARMENKNEMLKSKRKLLNRVFDRLIDELVRSDKADKYLKILLEKVANEYDKGEIIPSKEHKAKLKNTKFDITDNATEKRGGFVFRSGSVEIDLTFESIVLNELKDELESQTAEILFG